MLRSLAVLVPLLAFAQDESLEALARKAHAELEARRPAAAAALIDEIRRRDPRWSDRRDLVYQAAESGLFRGDALRARGLDLLRRLQEDFPGTARDALFAEAVAALTGYGFLGYDGLARPAAQARLEASESVNPTTAEGRPRVSTIAHYRLRDEAVRDALDRVLSGGDVHGAFWAEVPRAAWEVVGRHATRDARPAFDLSRPGLHVLEEEMEGLRHESLLTVSSFDLLVKRTGRSVLAWAFRPSDGEPVPGVLVHMRADGRTTELRTGADGLALTEADRVEAVVGRLGPEVHIQGLGLLEDEVEPETRIYITTDRPIYRPGQTVRFKAVCRGVHRGALRRPSAGPVPVEIKDPEGRRIHEAQAEWSPEGTMSGAFRLGEEPALGDYRLRIGPPRPDTWDGQPWGRVFTVAEYRKPELKVAVEFPEGPPVLGDEVRALIRVDYHWGGPAAGVDVAWTAERAPLYGGQRRGPAEDPRLDFYRAPSGDGDDGAKTWEAWWGGEPVTNGQGRTGSDGTLEVRFKAERPKDDRSGAYAFSIDAQATDASRFAAEGRGSIEATSADVRVFVTSSAGFAVAGRPFEARVRVTDRAGRPAPDRPIELAAFTSCKAPDQPAEFESFFSGRAPSDADGWASFMMTPDREGLLRLRARARDDAGRAVEDRHDLPAWGAGDPGVHESLAVVPERLVYEPGETARLLVRLPRRGLTGLLTVEGGGVHDARVLRFREASEIVEVPLRDAHAPNVFVKVIAWKDGECHAGGHEIAVRPAASWIDVEVAADRAAWKPGETGRVSVTTRLQGRPVAAEVELAAVDEPIFDLEKDRSPDIRRFFLRPREEDVLNFASGGVFEDTVPLFGAWAGGGGPLAGATFALAEAAEGGASVRKNFPDTLLWLGHVRTGADGRAEVDLKMADALTTWRLTARAVAGDDRFGWGVSKTLCRKDVFVRLAAPRFFTERDRGEVAAVVHNDRTEDLDVRVRMEADGLEVDGGEKRVRVPAGGAVRVDWPVRAAGAGQARLRVFAESSGGSDAMELPVPVKPHGVERVLARTSLLKAGWTTTFEVPAGALPGTARLDVSVRSAGMAAVLDALPGLAGYPYGCVEQTMSRFLPSVAAADALRRLGARNERLEAELPAMVDAGLRRLYDFQHEDGGWGWWKDDGTHPFMTAYVVYGLGAARRAGVAVRPDVLENGVKRLAAMAATPFGAYALTAVGHPVDLGAVEAATDEDRAWLILAGRRDLAAAVRGMPPSAATGAAIREAALVVRALGRIDAGDLRVRGLVEWLMLQRRGDGWLSTLDTAHVVYAMCERAAAEAVPAFSVRIDGAEAALENGRLQRTDLRPGAITIAVEGGGDVPSFASAVLRYRTGEEDLAEQRGAFEVTRRLEIRGMKDGQETAATLASGAEVKAGGLLWVVVEVAAREPQEYVMVECPLPAGAEPAGAHEEGFWGPWFWERREVRDDRVCFALRAVDGRREFAFPVRMVMPGELHVMPARAFAMYDPDRQGASAEFKLRVK